MANSLFDDIKSRLGLAPKEQEEPYDAYEDEYFEEDEEFEDDYADDYEPARDSFHDRYSVTTRSGSGLPSLVSMDDARASVRSASFSKSPRSSSVRSYGRTMVDSSLPPSMTSEGAAAVSAASNRRAEGLDSLFSSTRSKEGKDRGTSALTGFSSPSLNSHQLSIPGQRQLQVIRPAKYDDAESVTKVLKEGDVAIVTFTGVPQELMVRILDFSFGAASAMDASVECIGEKVFAFTRSVPLDEKERSDLSNIDLS